MFYLFFITHVLLCRKKYFVNKLQRFTNSTTMNGSRSCKMTVNEHPFLCIAVHVETVHSTNHFFGCELFRCPRGIHEIHICIQKDSGYCRKYKFCDG